MSSGLGSFFRENLLARNTAWGVIGNAARLPMQAAYFIIVARTLGSHEFGRFISVSSLVGIAAPFAGLGGGLLLIKNVSRERSLFPAYFGHAIATTAASGVALMALLLLAARFVLPPDVPAGLVAAVALSDLFFLSLQSLTVSAFTAVESLEVAATLNFVFSASKLAAALLLRFLPGAGAGAWAVLYLAGTAVPALACMLRTVRVLGAPSWAASVRGAEWAEGFHFAVASSAQSINSDLDKTVLARLASPAAAGVYGAAYRFMSVSMMPFKAFLSAVLARFFRHGAGGVESGARFALGLQPLPAFYGAMASVGLWFGAPLIPLVLGPGYADSVPALRWLAPLPLLEILLEFPANVLSVSGHQGLRSQVQMLAAAVNLGLLVWLVPGHSWRGAAWASIACDSLQVAGFWGVVALCRKRGGAV